MENDKPKYGTIPINLLRNIHEDKKGTIEKMLDYAIYDRMRKNYPTLDDDDFNGSEIEESMIYFNLNPDNLFARLERGKEIYDTFQGTPNASVNFDKLLEFQGEKGEFDLMVFCFYCAIRSIIGTKPFCKGTDKYWIARAFGYSTIKEYEDSNPTQAEKKLRVRYSSKDGGLKRIKKRLQMKWRLIYVTSYRDKENPELNFGVQGYYVSFKMTKVSLIRHAKEKSKKQESIDFDTKDKALYKETLKGLTN